MFDIFGRKKVYFLIVFTLNEYRNEFRRIRIVIETVNVGCKIRLNTCISICEVAILSIWSYWLIECLQQSTLFLLYEEYSVHLNILSWKNALVAEMSNKKWVGINLCTVAIKWGPDWVTDLNIFS
jgi:hypothetical protein